MRKMPFLVARVIKTTRREADYRERAAARHQGWKGGSTQISKEQINRLRLEHLQGAAETPSRGNQPRRSRDTR